MAEDTIKIIARIASQSSEDTELEEVKSSAPPADLSKDRICLVTPVADEEEASAEDAIRSLLDQGWYVFGERTPGRKHLKTGDRICFYHSGVGVVAEATVASQPEKRIIKFVRDPIRFPWAFQVRDVRYFFDKPIVIDAKLRTRLDKFKDRDPTKAWAWSVQGTSRVTEHDFEVLIGRA